MPDTRAAFGRWEMAVCAGLALMGVTWCGSSGTYPVHGKLEYEDGKPVTELDGFTVTFTSEKLGKSAVGTIQENGTFRLTSVVADDGAFPGHYKVILTQPHPERDRWEQRTPVVDPVYEDLSKTPLKADVEAKSNEFTFPLQRYQARPRGKKG